MRRSEPTRSSSAVRKARRAIHRDRRPVLERMTEWLFAPGPDEAARLAQGAHHVRLGVTMAAIALAADYGADIVDHGFWRMRDLGLVSGLGVLVAGALASSRIVRVLLLLAALVMGLSLESLSHDWHIHRAGYGFPAWYLATRTGAALLFVVGAALATLSPAALAYHRAQVEAREARRARKQRGAASLAAWRGDEPHDDSDTTR